MMTQNQLGNTSIAKNLDAGFTHFFISRKCNISLNDLLSFNNLQISNSTALLQKMNQLKKLFLPYLLNELYQKITIVHQSHRDSLIQLKRNLYNDRPIKESVDAVLNLYAFDEMRLALNYFKQLECLIAEQEQFIDTSYDAYLMDLRFKLAIYSDNECFQKAMQLSGQRFLKKIRTYRDACLNQKVFTKSLRQTEETLINYYYRMALKPSPFAAFTTINAHIANSDLFGQQLVEHRFCSISRTLIIWISKQLMQHADIKMQMPLLLNSTLTAKDDHLIFFVRSDEGNKNMYGGEKFIQIKNSPILTTISTLLKKKELDQTSLISELTTQVGNQEKYSEYIDELISLGLLERQFLISDLTAHYAGAISHKLKELKGLTAQKLVSLFMNIDNIENKFALASIQQREAYLNDLVTLIEDILEILALPKLDLSHIRNLIYEDVGKIYYDIDCKMQQFHAFRHPIGILSKILPILDDAVIERLAIYDYFKRQLVNTDSTTSLLSFYHHFGKLEISALTELMQGNQSKEVMYIRALRAEWFAYLHHKVQTSLESENITLEDKWLLAFVNKIPNYVYDLESSIFYVQPCHSQSNQLMFNGVSLGYGALYSRFCNIFGEKENNQVLQALRVALKSTFEIENMTDLMGVLGVNTNIHPPIFESFIEYPKCVVGDGHTIYRLNAINIKANDMRKRLTLVCANTGKDIHFRPLNFLYPAVGPSLYRFLYLFTPFINFKGGMWKRYLSIFPQEERYILPRINIDNIVLDRRTWKIPVQFLSHIDGEAQPKLWLQEVAVWQSKVGLPSQVFFQIIDTFQHSDWMMTMQDHMRFNNKSKTQKPQFLDFHNPILIRRFLKAVKNQSNGCVLLQECLPMVEVDVDQEPKFIEEYLLQYNWFS